ncbi:MAG: porin, partial [Betaproteobacteria bacterium]|nr:porin [Betaproteobacteria bacterium]
MAVAGVLSLSSASQAAIDDAGMKYVSASEGLSGSIRIKVLADDNGENVDPRTDFSRSRIVYNGDTDLGGGMAATYFFEFRPRIKEDDDNGSNDDEFQVKYIDAGLKGPFGHIRVGEIETVSEAILPNADRSNDNGTSGASLVEDYDRGLRWISPNINGLNLGVSAKMIDNKDKEDDAVDVWDIVATYELPMGLAVGGSYAVKGSKEDGKEDEEGFRLGAEYEQDNWGVAYNFHSYKASIADRDEDDFLAENFDTDAFFYNDTATTE